MAATRTELEGRRVTVRLDPGLLVEALILKRLNTVPKRRHPDWIRALLVQGFLAECRVVRQLKGTASENAIAKRRMQPSPGSGFDFGDGFARSANPKRDRESKPSRVKQSPAEPRGSGRRRQTVRAPAQGRGIAHHIEQRRANVSEQPMNPMSVGLDDGYAFTKLALPDGRLVAIPSRARLGRANVTWIDNAEQRIFEYETEDQSFAVGEVDGEPTYFDAYPFSGLNRAIVQHGLQQAGLGGHSLHAVSGLPVSSFYLKDGSRREATLAKKRDSLTRAVHPIDGRLPAAIAFHDVIPEALAAWYDHVITESDDGVQLASERLQAPVAVVDIGGRTTDVVVVADQAVQHGSSGSLRCGLLDVKREVTEGIRSRFDMEVVSERCGRGGGSTRSRQAVRQRPRCRGSGEDGTAAACRAPAGRNATAAGTGRGTRAHPLRGWRHGRARRAPTGLVSEPGGGRSSGLCQCARDAEVPALRLRDATWRLMPQTTITVLSVVTAVQWQIRHPRTV